MLRLMGNIALLFYLPEIVYYVLFIPGYDDKVDEGIEPEPESQFSGIDG